MSTLRLVVSSASVLLTLAGPARADHNHMTVDTASGSPGDPIIIRAGYYPAETAFTISEGRLLRGGEIAVYEVVDQIPDGGPLGGWRAGDELLLTSDFYFATGRLEGGNFMWELASVAPLSGGPGSLVWGDFDMNTGELVPLADSTAPTRMGRSFDTLIAGHDHEQGYAFSTPGVYDVTFVAWDSNGVYADSAPVTLRFRVHSGCDADFNLDGFVDFFDYLDFVAAFEAGSESADLTGDAFVDFFDYDAFVGAFEAGC